MSQQVNAIAEAMRQHRSGDLEGAEQSYKAILQADPGNADALHLLGVLYRQTKRLQEAADSIAEAVRIQPTFAAFHHNLGNCLADMGRSAEAMNEYREAIRLRPGVAIVHHALGTLLHESGDATSAIEQYREAVRLDPNFGTAHAHLGAALAGEEHFDEAIAHYRRALALSPKDETTHWNLAMSLLVTGEMDEGWREFERRWDFITDLRRPDLKGDLWQPGEDLRGKRLLLHVEGGFGDAFNFVRYAPMAAKMGARVTLECARPIVKLFQRVEGVERVIERGKEMVEFDRHCPFQGLPLRFGTTLEHGQLKNAGAPVPYIAADEQLAKHWAQRLVAEGISAGTLKVGLCWAGNQSRLGNRTRELRVFAALGQVEGVQLISLQVGDQANQASPPGMKLLRFNLPLDDFSHAAAIIANLDLVISIDSAIAHLAGAMGKRVWTLIPRPPEFRWLLGREDSVWYPTMRLFREDKPGQWQAPVMRMAQALRELRDGSS